MLTQELARVLKVYWIPWENFEAPDSFGARHKAFNQEVSTLQNEGESHFKL
jgi:hypothetical protein